MNNYKWTDFYQKTIQQKLTGKQYLRSYISNKDQYVGKPKRFLLKRFVKSAYWYNKIHCYKNLKEILQV